MVDINFLRKQRITFSKTENKDKKIFLVAIGFLTLSVISLIISLSISFYYKSEVKKTIAEQKHLTSVVLGEEKTEREFLIFANKLSAIKEIFENRSDKQEAIGFFSNLFGESVFIAGMTYNGENGTLSLGSVSKNIFDLENTFALLDGQEVKSNFDSLKKSSLSRGDNGEYSMGLTVSLKKEGDQKK